MDLPYDVHAAVLDRLDPRSLKSYMATCRAADAIGRDHAKWDDLRRNLGMREPKAGARKYKTSLDIMLPVLCRRCWAREADRDKCGLCGPCVFANGEVMTAWWLTTADKPDTRSIRKQMQRCQQEMDRLRMLHDMRTNGLRGMVQKMCIP